MPRQFDTFQDLSVHYISDSYKSLLRVRGGEEVPQQINRLENEWLQLIKEADAFMKECKNLFQRKYLFLSLKIVYQYNKSENMKHYDRKKFYLPYLSFCYRNKSLTQWKDVQPLLQQMQATVEETILHMWVFKGCKNFYLRARMLSSQIDNLTEYHNLNSNLLQSTNLKKSMLPKAMLMVPDENKLPGSGHWGV